VCFYVALIISRAGKKFLALRLPAATSTPYTRSPVWKKASAKMHRKKGEAFEGKGEQAPLPSEGSCETMADPWPEQEDVESLGRQDKEMPAGTVLKLSGGMLHIDTRDFKVGLVVQHKKSGS
jgi:hypothetical protein